jgi:AraC-like DNA-binding protein
MIHCTKAQLIELHYHQKMTKQAMAEQLSISVYRLNQLFEEFELISVHYRTDNLFERELLEKMNHDKGWSKQVMAEELGVSVATVTQAFESAGANFIDPRQRPKISRHSLIHYNHERHFNYKQIAEASMIDEQAVRRAFTKYGLSYQKPQKHLSIPREELVILNHEERLSMSAIARAFNKRPSHISALFKEYGLEYQAPEHKTLPLMPEIDKKWLKRVYVEEKQSLVLVAKTAGIGLAQLLVALQHHHFIGIKSTQSEVYGAEALSRTLFDNQGVVSRAAKSLNLTVYRFRQLLTEHNIDFDKDAEDDVLFDERTLRQLYETQMLTLAVIAAKFETTAMTVSRYLKRYNIEARGSRRIKHKLTDILLFELSMEQNLSVGTIAKTYNCSMSTVEKRRKDLLIKLKKTLQ